MKKADAGKAVKKAVTKKSTTEKVVSKAVPEKKKPVTVVTSKATPKAVKEKPVQKEKPVVKQPVSRKKGAAKKTSKPVAEPTDPNQEVITTSVTKSELARIKSQASEVSVKQQGRLVTFKKDEDTVVQKPLEKTRYSDKELTEFRDLINRKLEDAKSELKYLQEQISRTSELGDDSDSRFKGLEDGTSTAEREYLSQMASRQIQYISHLEKALIRIQNKTYGICRETGKLISKERLRAVPHATLSIEAKKNQG